MEEKQIDGQVYILLTEFNAMKNRLEELRQIVSKGESLKKIHEDWKSAEFRLKERIYIYEHFNEAEIEKGLKEIDDWEAQRHKDHQRYLNRRIDNLTKELNYYKENIRPRKWWQFWISKELPPSYDKVSVWGFIP